MNVRWTLSAARNLRSIDAYVRERDRLAAGRLVTRLTLAADLLSTQPELGRPMRKGRRRFVVSGTPYSLIYAVRTDRVDILAVFHERQRPEPA